MRKHDPLLERCKHELSWYYQCADAAVGISSNYWPMIMAAQFCGGGYTDQISKANSTLAAVDRRRKVERVLDRLSSAHRAFLRLRYGHEHHLPHDVATSLKDLTAAALIASGLNKEDLGRLCRRVQVGAATEKEKTKLSEIRISAESFQRSAFTALTQAAR